MSGEGFTESEVAERVGTTPQTIRRLAELGVLEPEGKRYPARAVLRARVVLDLDRMGIDAEAVGQANASGDSRSDTSRSAVDDRLGPIGRSRTWARRSESRFRCCSASMWRSAFLGPKRTSWFGRRTTSSSPPSLSSSAPGSAKASLRMARVWGDSARKVSQFQTHYLHHSIEEPFRRRGLRDNEAFEGSAPRGSGPCRSVRRGPLRVAVPAPLKCFKLSTCSITSRSPGRCWRPHEVAPWC